MLGSLIAFRIVSDSINISNESLMTTSLTPLRKSVDLAKKGPHRFRLSAPD